MYKVAIYSTKTKQRIVSASGLQEGPALELVNGWKMRHNIFIYVEIYGKIEKNDTEAVPVL